jgi:hypothetical protein
MPISPESTGVSGVAGSVSGHTAGVRGISESTSGQGVMGQAPVTTGHTHGVWGESY